MEWAWPHLSYNSPLQAIIRYPFLCLVFAALFAISLVLGSAEATQVTITPLTYVDGQTAIEPGSFNIIVDDSLRLTTTFVPRQAGDWRITSDGFDPLDGSVTQSEVNNNARLGDFNRQLSIGFEDDIVLFFKPSGASEFAKVASGNVGIVPDLPVLRVVGVTPTSITLEWDDVDGARGYHLFINAVAHITTDPSITFDELDPGTEYSIAAITTTIGSNAISARSAPLDVTTLAVTPLSATITYADDQTALAENIFAVILPSPGNAVNVWISPLEKGTLRFESSNIGKNVPVASGVDQTVARPLPHGDDNIVISSSGTEVARISITTELDPDEPVYAEEQTAIREGSLRYEPVVDGSSISVNFVPTDAGNFVFRYGDSTSTSIINKLGAEVTVGLPVGHDYDDDVIIEFGGVEAVRMHVTTPSEDGVSIQAGSFVVVDTINADALRVEFVPLKEGTFTVTAGDTSETVDVSAGDVSESTPKGTEITVGYEFDDNVILSFGGKDAARIHVTTGPTPLVPSAPSLRITGTTHDTVTLSWDAVHRADTYTLTRTLGSNPAVTVLSGIADLTFTDKNLAAETDYTYSLTAINSVGPSEPSEDTVTTDAAPTPPDTPTLVAGVTTHNTVSLSWDEPTGADSYILTRTAGTVIIEIPVTGGTHTDDALKSGVQYTYSIRAVSAIGASPDSNDVIVTTIPVPITPTTPTYTDGQTAIDESFGIILLGDGTAGVFFDATDDGKYHVGWGAETSTPITYEDGYSAYVVIPIGDYAGVVILFFDDNEVARQVVPAVISPIKDGTLSVTDDADGIITVSLTPAFAGTFSVSTNSLESEKIPGVPDTQIDITLDVGHGFAEDVLVSFNNIIVAGIFVTTVPDAPALVLGPVTSTSITLSWNSVDNADRYTLTRTADGTDVIIVSGNVLTFTDEGLAAGTNYVYAITATTPEGRTGAISAELAVDIGSAAESFGVIVDGDGASVSFTPLVPGDFTIGYGDDSANDVTISVATGKLSAKLTTIKVGYNFNGPVTLSLDNDIIGRILIVTEPPPTTLDATAVTDTSITLAWPPQPEVQEYRLYRNGALVVATGELSYTDTGLDSNTAYTYHIESHNDVSTTSDRSADLDVTTLIEPPRLVAGEITTTSVELTWDAVAGANDYVLYRDGVNIALVTGTTHKVTGLAAGTEYSFTAESRHLNFLTSPLSSPLSVRTVPDTPALRVTGTTFDTITLSWSPVNGAASYTLTRVVEGDDVTVFSGDALTATDENLSPATSYNYIITATTSGGTSAPSAEFAASTASAVPIITTSSQIVNTPSITIAGTAESGKTVELFQGETSAGTTTADGTGAFSFEVTLADGANSFTATASDGTDTSVPSSPIVITLDTEKPLITVLGSDETIELTAADTYAEPGATVEDNDPAYSEDVTVAGNTPDTSVIRVYTVTYNAPADAAGNEPDQQSITITVSDTTPPTFDVDGHTTNYATTVPFAGTYTQGIIANESDISGIASGTVGGKSVNVHVSAEYAVTYTVTDNNGQAATITETVTVGDDEEKPVITPLGSSETIIVSETDTYTEPDATVKDNDPAYSEDVTVAGDTPDTSVVGEYTVLYTAPADAAGNIPDEKSIVISIVDPPTSPPATIRTLSVSSTTHDSITLSWDAVATAASYTVTRIVDGGPDVEVASEITELTATDENLAADTTYKYTIKAINSAGASTSLEFSLNTAAIPAAPAAPVLSVTSTTDTTVSFSWGAVEGADSYTLTRVVADGSDVPVPTTPELTATDENLAPETSYNYIITATNAGGTTPSATFEATTSAPPAPATPVFSTVVSATHNSINLSWSAVAGADSYTLTRVAESGNNVRVFSGDALTFTNAGLDPDTAYNYIIMATNSAGTSEPSDQFTATTSTAPPTLVIHDTPTLVAGIITYNTVNLSWDEPAGADSYILTRTAGTDTTEIPVIGGTHADDTLEPTTQYTYSVKAVSASGDSADSNDVIATTIPVPILPTTPTYAVDQSAIVGTSFEIIRIDDDTITVSFDAINDGEYYVQWGESETSPTTITGGNSASVQIPIDDYAGVVILFFEDNEVARQQVPAVTSPIKDGTLSVTDDADGIITVSLTPAFAGTFSVGTHSLDSEKIPGVPDTTIVITLDVGHGFAEDVLVSFNNIIVAKVFVTTVPETPALVLGAVTGTSIALSWGSVDNADSYTLTRTADGTDVIIVSGNVLTFTDEGLAAGTNYVYAITATTPEGRTSATSADLAVTIGSAAQSFDVIADGDDASISFTPLVPGDFTIGYGDDSSNDITVTIASDEVDEPSTTPVTVGYNFNGPVTLSLDNDIIGRVLLVTEPPPTALDATAVTDTSIILAWPSQPEVQEYRLYRNGALVVATGELSYTDTGLAAETVYIYHIESHNDISTTSDQSANLIASTGSAAAPGTPAEIPAIESGSFGVTAGVDDATASFVPLRSGDFIIGYGTDQSVTVTIAGDALGKASTTTVPVGDGYDGPVTLTFDGEQVGTVPVRAGITNDTEKPVITPTGSTQTIELTAADTYTEPGATVKDNDPAYSEKVTVAGDTPDTSVIGEYTVLYNAPADAAGNEPDQQSIAITVSDTTPPAFDVDGHTTDYATTVPFAGTYTQGIIANESDISGIASSVVGGNSVDVNVPGQYAVTYTVTDGNEQVATITETVTVEPDAEKPVITPMGSTRTIELTATNTYAELGATVTDNDRDYSGTVTVTGDKPNTGAVGVYIVTYTAPADAAGNEPDPQSIVISVVDTPVPTGITYTEGQTAIEEGSLGYTLNDPGNTISVDFKPLKAGTYKFQYGVSFSNVQVSEAEIGENKRLLIHGIGYNYNADIVISLGSTEVASVSVATGPAPPVLSVGAVTDTSIAFSWGAVTGATHYNVYRDGIVQGRDIGVTSFADTGLTPGTEYAYHVIAFNGLAASASSNVESVTTTGTAPVTIPDTPTLSIVATTHNSIELSWTAVENADSYTLTRIVDGDDNVPVPTTDALSATDTGLSAATDYKYVITATNSDGTSDPSAEFDARTGDSPTYTIDHTLHIDGDKVVITFTSSHTDDFTIEFDGGRTIGFRIDDAAVPYIHTETVGYDYDGNVSIFLGLDEVAKLPVTTGSEPTVTAVRNADNSVTVSWSNIETSITNEYVLTISDGSSDSDTFTPSGASNQHTISTTRTIDLNDANEVCVKGVGVDNKICEPVPEAFDITAPVITVTGSDTTIELTATDTYTIPGATVADNDPNYSETVAVTGDTPDTSSIGVYTVLYDAPNDAAGNKPEQESITITVVDTTPPTFDVNGNTDDYSTAVPFGETYTPGAIANAFDISGIVSSDVGGDTVNVNTSRDYVVTYTVTDSNGRTTTITETVTVGPDVTAPAVPEITTSPATVNTPSFTIDGTAEAGTTVALFNGGTSVDTVIADSGSFSFTVTLTEGENSFTVTASDGPNTSDASPAIVITLDTIPPEAPIITTPPATVNTPSFTIEGTAEAGTTVALFNGVTPAGTTTADGSGNFSFTVTLTDGENAFTATASDGPNTSDASPAIVITLDTIPPEAPEITTSPATVNTPSFTIEGTAEAGTTVELLKGGTSTGDTVAADGDGNFSFTVTLTDGENSFTATASDGPNTSAASPAIVITLDTIPPEAPEITTSPATVNTSSFTIEGTAEAGTTVALLKGATSTGDTVTADSGSFSFTVTLTDGENSFTATASDGPNTSASSSPVLITLDTTAPAVPAITTPPATVNTPSITIDGTAEAGSTVELFRGVTTVDTVTADSGSFSFTVTLTDGENSFTATASDGPNTSDASSPVLITLDTIAPAVPEITTSPATVNTSSFTIDGTAEAGSTVELFRGVTSVDTVTADSGSFSFTVTLTDGENSFTATASDGPNTSDASSPVLITLDTIPPEAPEITTSPATVNTPSFTIDGTAEAGTTVALLKGATSTGDTVAADSGSFSFTVTLTDGENSFTATASDGPNTSDASSPVLITLDTIAPAVPEITTSPATVNTSSFTIEGTAEAGTTVALLKGATSTGDTVTADSGSFSFTVTLTKGANSFTVTASDGPNTSASSSPVLITLDTTAPAVPAITTPPATVNTPSITIDGTAEAGSTVELFRGVTTVDTVTADSGSFSFTVTLTDGENSFTATASDGPNTSAASPAIVITLDTIPPEAPEITTSPATVNTPSFTIEGTAEAGTTVALLKGATSTGDTVTADSGSFSFTVTLTKGANSFTVTASDGPNTSASSSPVLITLDTTAPAVPAITTPPATVNTPSITIDGTAEAGSTVELFRGVTSVDTVTADSGSFSFTVTLTDGENSFTATASDGPNTSAASPAIVITLDTIPPEAPEITTSPATVNTPSITIDGTAEAGSTVELFRGVTSVDTVTADSGSFSFTVTLTDGENSFTATASDGPNTSDASSPVLITLDTIAPAVPEITTSPATVNTSSFTIEGTAEAGTTVALLKGATSTGDTVTADSGSFSFTVTLTKGANSFTVTASDGPNTSASSSPVLITLDTTAPAVPAITTPPATVNTPSFTIDGTAEAGSTVELFRGVTTVDTVTADSGSFSFTVTLTDGENSFTATASDGPNTSAASPAIVITLDTIPPEAPEITTSPATVNTPSFTIEGTAEAGTTVALLKGATSTGDTVTADSGSFSFTVTLTKGANSFTVTASDGPNTSASSSPVLITLDTTAPAVPAITTPPATVNTPSITIDGTAEAGSTVELFRGVTSVDTVTADSGSFSFTVTLTDGENSFTATASDGPNTSAASPAIVITLDTIPPEAPEITTSPATVNTPSFTIEGTAEAGTTVALLKGATSTGDTVAADGDGNFSFTVTLTKGANSFTVTASDGPNTSASSSPVLITLDTTAPAVPAITTPPATVNTPSITIDGTAEAGTTVELLKGGTSTGDTVAADGDGNFSFTVTLTDGENSFTATASDGPNTSAASPAIVITLDTIPPEAPEITTSPATVNTSSFTIEGTAEAGTTVALLKGATSTGDTVTADSGSFSFTVTLTDGENSFTATASDGPNTSAASSPVLITLDTIAPAAPEITTSPATVNTPSFTIEGTAEAGTTVELLKGGTSTGDTVTADSGSFSFTVTLTKGANSFTVTASDGPNTSASSSPVLITLDTTAPAVPEITTSPATVNTPSITIDGTAEAGSTVELFRGVTSVDTVTADSGSFSFTVTLTDGENSFTATASDGPNTSDASSPVLITLDTIAPAVPEITTSPATVNTSSFTIEGTAEAGTTVALLKGATSTGDTVTADSGSFSFTVTLTKGANSFTVTASDGPNTSASSSPVLITLDTTAPAVPAITTPPATVNTPSITIDGTAEAGSTVELFRGVTTVDTVTADSGSFSFTVTLTDGENSFTATASDGPNTSAASPAIVITLDTIPPEAPEITTSPATVNTPSFTIEGTAEAGTTVALLKGATSTGDTVAADGDGNFSFTVTLTDGENSFTATASDGPNTSDASPAIVITLDIIAPVITVDKDSFSVELGETYTAFTYSANDNTDGDITDNVVVGDTVDTSVDNTYNVTFDVDDAAGNHAVTVTRTVTVTPDATVPTITVNEDSLSVELGGTYELFTFTANDNTDGIITGEVAVAGYPADTDTIGTYDVTFDVDDAAGNHAVTVTRTVTVTADTTAPSITVNEESFSVELGETYTPFTFTATDNIDGDISSKVTVGGDTVDTGTIGTYDVTFDVVDAAGNPAVTVTRTVTVTDPEAPTLPDTEKPVITPAGSSETIELIATNTYTEQGATVEDNDLAYSETVTVSGDTPDTSSIGEYTVLYDAPDDAANNTPDQKSITITVVDTTAPTFDVDGNTGDYSTTVPFGETYTPGVIANAFDISGTAPGIVGGETVNVDTSREYVVTYTVTDNNGQVATITETVTVESDITAPAVPAITTPSATVGSTPITIVGTAEIGSTVELFRGGTSVDTTTADGSGNFSFTEVALDEGENSFTATASDGVNTSAASPSIVITLDTTPAGGIASVTPGTETPKKKGGDSNEWKTKPTFGKHWNNQAVQLVDDGFVFNGMPLTITNNWHTDFNMTSSIIGEDNTVHIKGYATNDLKSVSLSLGVPEVGLKTNAESHIIVNVNSNYTSPAGYDIADIVHEQREGLVNQNMTGATISKVKCTISDTTERCFDVTISFVIMAPLSHEVMAINAVDKQRYSTTTYINEGVEFTGEALLAAATHELKQKHGNQNPFETISLTQQDRRYQVWEDQYGYIWSQNDYGTWLQITRPDIQQRDDSPTSVMTRIHSNFANLVIDEQDRATLIFDSKAIQGTLDESFSYDMPLRLDRVSDPALLESLSIQEMLAQEMLCDCIIYDDSDFSWND